MKPSVLGTFHVCLLYFMFWGIFLHDCEGAATMYGGQGQSVTLFWNQTQGYQAFTIKDQNQMKTLITVSNYNTVTFSNRGNNGPPQFTGNLSSSGVGLFRFVLPDLQLTDAGKYRCFKSGPGRTWIPDCGVDLVVIHNLHGTNHFHTPTCGDFNARMEIQTLFMVVPDFVTPDSNSVVLSCHSSILPQHLHPEVVFTWRENDDVLTPDKRYSMGTGMNVWNVWKHFYSRLTISGVTKTDCWRKYSCRVEFEGQILSNWSKEYILGEDYSNSEDTDVTGAREGTNAVMIFKMPLLKSDVTISSPAGETVIQRCQGQVTMEIRPAVWTEHRHPWFLLLPLLQMDVSFRPSRLSYPWLLPRFIDTEVIAVAVSNSKANDVVVSRSEAIAGDVSETEVITDVVVQTEVIAVVSFQTEVIIVAVSQTEVILVVLLRLKLFLSSCSD